MGTEPRTVCLVLVALFGLSAPQTQIAQPMREQTSFSEFGTIESPLPLATDVLKVLMKTEAARSPLVYAKDLLSNPAKLFRGAEVHLDGSSEIDLVVIGITPMSGADNGWFWIVRSTPGNPKVLLWVGGNSIDVVEGRTNGYRDILSYWSNPNGTSTRIYHFDGMKYKLWKEKWVQNRR
jgi:hypothetical protein